MFIMLMICFNELCLFFFLLEQSDAISNRNKSVIALLAGQKIFTSKGFGLRRSSIENKKASPKEEANCLISIPAEGFDGMKEGIINYSYCKLQSTV